MTWTADAAYVPEVRKCRARLIGYCQGQGLDIGCGSEKIKTSAIGLDMDKGPGPQVDLAVDLEGGLTLFADGAFDYVFSSHCLEDSKDPLAYLQEWWRVIRPGGNLVLYLPHKDLYPRIGQPGANPAHRNDFEPADIFRMMNEFASYNTLCSEIHGEEDEYSFEIVLQKTADFPGVPEMRPRAIETAVRRTAPRACVVRYGGIGDMIIATPVIRLLKEQGYHVTVNTSENGREMLKHNPHVDRIIFQGMNEVPNADLESYWKRLAKDYDRFVNLSGTLEEALLLIKGRSPDYELPEDERRAKYGNINYYDHALKVAGFDVRKLNGEIFLSDDEEMAARVWRATLSGRFVVIWALGGSGPHKRFPWYGMAIEAFLREHPEAVFITVGGHPEKLLELAADEDPNIIHRSGRWGIRTVAAAIKYADLVVGPETGALNIAGCFPTPKICMLTHSSWANLCKHWENDYSVQSRADCSPCHRMIYMENDCPQDERFKVCKCASEFDPNDLLPKMKEVFRKWRRQNSTLIALPVSESRQSRTHAGLRKVGGNTIQ